MSNSKGVFMGLTVTFRHLESNEALKSYTQEKVSRIEKFLNKVNDIHVILSLEKRRHIAEVIVNVNRAMITAKEVSEDNMYSAIDLVMDKIERQAKKHKDRITNHKDLNKQARHNIFSSESYGPDKRPEIVKTESVSIKPLSVDEALVEIDQANEDFLVFKNAETEKVSVIYRRRDGDFGLIEPENQ